MAYTLLLLTSLILSEVMDPKMWFEKRCISFVKKALDSSNKVVS